MSDERTFNSPLYRSCLTGEPLTLRGARIATVAADDIPRRPQFRGTVIKANIDNPDDKKAIEAINQFYWGSMEQDIFGRTYDIFDCDNYLARPESDETGSDDPSCHRIAGHLAITIEEEGFLHIVVFHVWPQWHGRAVGRRLLDKAVEFARDSGLSTIKLGTTNDNIPALYFYQRAGFVIEKVVPGEVADSHGGAPPGFAGIPVRDEIQMRLDL